MPDPHEGPDALHLLFVSDEGLGVWMTSPQVPDLAYASPNPLPVDSEDVRAALQFAGAPDLPIVPHQVREGEHNGVEFTVRIAEDDHRDERIEIATRLGRAMASDPAVLSEPAAPTGVIQFVCVLPNDRVGWVLDQMFESGDCIVLTAAVADDLILTQTLGYALPDMDSEGWGHLALDRSATMADLLRDSLQSDTKRTPILA